jgi:TRAP-type C4-dicarboxylate transport system permease small subunit
VFVDHVLPARYRPYVLVATDICCLIFTVWLTWLSMRYTLRLVGGATSPALFIPMWMIYAAMPVGCLMMTLRYVITIAARLKELRETPRGEQNI